jgi:hypothetical protein
VTAILRDAESSRTGIANTFSSTGWPTIVVGMSAGQFACERSVNRCTAQRVGNAFTKDCLARLFTANLGARGRTLPQAGKKKPGYALELSKGRTATTLSKAHIRM